MKLDGYSLLLPEGTLDYFDVINVVEDSTQIVIYLEEKNLIPEEYKDKDTESKGFYEPVVIRDFPIRGRQVFLNVRRRRWIIKPGGQYISRNWHMVASGTSMTREFASFLKRYVDSLPVSCKTIGALYGIDGDKFERYYRDHLSGYHEWDQLSHASEWVLFDKNIGAYVGLDEVCLEVNYTPYLSIKKRKVAKEV